MRMFLSLIVINKRLPVRYQALKLDIYVRIRLCVGGCVGCMPLPLPSQGVELMETG